MLALFLSVASLSERALAVAPKSEAVAWQPTVQFLENYIYELEIYHYGYLVHLSKGVYMEPAGSAAEFRISLVQSAIGDLNNDGLSDAVVELKYQPEVGNLVHVIKFMLNDGKRLVDVGTYDLGMFEMVNGLCIANGKVTGQLEKFGESGTKEEAFSAIIVNEPLMRARTYQVSKTIDELGDRQNYCNELAIQLRKRWLEIKSELLKPPSSSNNKKSSWLLDPHSMRPVVITLNNPDVQLSASSNDPTCDSVAYQAIDSVRRETSVPREFIDANLPMECAFTDDTVTCRDLAPRPKTIDIQILRPHQNNGSSSEQQAVKELMEAAIKFPSKSWYKILQEPTANNENVANLQCAMKVAGDFTGDGQNDLVVLLHKLEKGESNQNSKIKNLIVPLIYDHGTLRQMSQQFYCLETATFANRSTDLFSNIEVTKLEVTPKKIVIFYQGKRENKLAPLNVTYVTEIDLVPQVVAEVLLNGQPPPPPEDELMREWGKLKRHHARPSKQAQTMVP
jgi:hypothetical protein